MVRFFVNSSEMVGQTLLLTGENAAHAKVLRLKAGEEVSVCDGSGEECLCKVRTVEQETITLSVCQRRLCDAEARVKASVYMAFAKGDKLEHVIQKATELGAYEIVAFPSARCVSKPDGKSLNKKTERWQKIAAAAAEQSNRGRIPDVVVLDSYRGALKRAAQADISLFFYENEHARTLHDSLRQKAYTTVSLMTGPEGGWDPAEVEMAMDEGMDVCTLGRRILRCETAPLCALSAIMYDSGEF